MELAAVVDSVAGLALESEAKVITTEVTVTCDQCEQEVSADVASRECWLHLSDKILLDKDFCTVKCLKDNLEDKKYWQDYTNDVLDRVIRPISIPPEGQIKTKRLYEAFMRLQGE